MKILANRKIKTLFIQIFLILCVFTATLLLLALLLPTYTIVIIPGSTLVMGAFLMAALYFYFKEQNAILEHASSQIDTYLSGNHEVRLESDEDGELYRLFHEVNTLVSILNAHAESETKAKQSLRNTIADISHQLKTPLAALNIYIGIMQEEATEHPEIKEFTDLSEQELDRMETLVQNLLKIAKLDAGTISFEKKEENLSEMLHAIQKHFSLRCKQEEKTIQLAGNNDLLLSCDRTWLIEAISNVVKNALDHTDAGNTITITWKQSTALLQLQIKDNGHGIHPEDLYHIFKRFYRSRFGGDTQGIGLGLPLAKAIIEAHNGTIAVDSELGIGTTFTINFLIPTKL